MKHKNEKWIWINSRGKVTKWSQEGSPHIMSGTHTDITDKKQKQEKNIFDIYKEADNNMYKNKLKYGRIMRNKTIEKVLDNVNKRYDKEKAHTERVAQYCENIEKAMDLNKKEIEDVFVNKVL